MNATSVGKPRVHKALVAFMFATLAYTCYVSWTVQIFRGTASPNPATADQANQIAKITYMVVLALASLLMAYLKQYAKSARRQSAWLLVAALCMSGGFCFCLLPNARAALLFPTMTLGVALAAVGAGVLVPFYGRAFGLAGPKGTAVSVFVSAMGSAALTQAIALLPRAAVLCVTGVLPFFAGAFIWGAVVKIGEGRLASPPSMPGPANNAPPLPAPVLATALVAGFLGMFVQSAMMFAGVSFSVDSTEYFAVRLAALALLTGGVLVFGRNYDTYSVFWPFVSPVLLAICLFLLLAGSTFPSVAVALFGIAHNCLTSFVYTLYVDMSVRLGRSADDAFCWGKSFDSVGCVLGLFGGFVCGAVLNVAEGFWFFISVVCFACSVLVAFAIFLSRRLNDPDVMGQEAPRRPDLASLCQAASRTYALSPREAQVLELLGRGRSVPYIAGEFGVSASTVKNQVRSIYGKMNVHERQELLNLLYDGAPKER